MPKKFFLKILNELCVVVLQTSNINAYVNIYKF